MKNEMKGIKRLFLILSALFIVFAAMICAHPAYADDAEDYTTESYNVDIKVAENNTYKCTETITLDFGEKPYGSYIDRVIPLGRFYRVSDLRVFGSKGYHVKNDTGDKYITFVGYDYDDRPKGVKIYKISYTIRGIKDPRPDTLERKLLPEDWGWIKHVSVNIELPKSMTWTSIKCEAGEYGESYGSWDVSEKGHYIKYTATDLPEDTLVKVTANLPGNYWKNEINHDWMKYILIVILGGLTLAMLVMRRVLGKNPKITEIRSFYPPEGITPLEAGYLIDADLADIDVLSLIFYLADKGYMSVRKYKNGHYVFTKLKIPNKETTTVRQLFRGIFGADAMKEDGKIKTVRFGDAAMFDPDIQKEEENLSTRIYHALNDIKGSLEKKFKGKKASFTKESMRAEDISIFGFFIAIMATFWINIAYFGRIQCSSGVKSNLVFMIIHGVVALLLIYYLVDSFYNMKSGNMKYAKGKFALFSVLYTAFAVYFFKGICLNSYDGFLDWRITIPLLIYFAATPFLICGMRKRSKWSADMFGSILGFKDFIEDAGMDELDGLVKKDPGYFYHILPYAYVFQLTEQWVVKYPWMTDDKPDWYTPSDKDYIFDAPFIVSMVNDLAVTFKASTGSIED